MTFSHDQPAENLAVTVERTSMQSFIQQHEADIVGVLSGFDRLVLRGQVRAISFVDGMLRYLALAGVLLKEFGDHVQRVSQELRWASLARARALQRPIIYLPSSRTNKEEVALAALKEHPVSEGLVAVVTCVEPCPSFDIHRNAETKRLELVPRWRKCLHLYHDLIHPRFGWMNARIQTWFPFNIQICLNGREWLSRQMTEEGVSYDRADNCFPWIEDVSKAQALADEQLCLDWPVTLDGVAGLLNPAHEEILAGIKAAYYWTVHQSEWATDVMFKDEGRLSELYPALVHHAITTFESPDVLRFLGRKLNRDGQIPRWFNGEITTSLKRRPEGVRVKHSVDGNSLKMYDKFGRVLRVESTTNHPEHFKVYRPREKEPGEEMAWQPMRQSVADLYRRTQVAQAANDRYLSALASVSETTPLKELADTLCQPAALNGRRVRALNPWAPDDGALLAAITRGEFAINGLRNRDLQRLFYSDAADSKEEKRRRCGAISRRLRMLRAHGLLKKVPKTHRYVLTDRGRLIVTALLAAREASTESLTKKAA